MQDQSQHKSNNALRSAAALNDLISLKKALDNAEINSTDSKGKTAAHFSVTNGHPDCLKLLLTAGIDIDQYGFDLVEIVVIKKQSLGENDDKFKAYEACLQLLLDCGAATIEEVEAITDQIKQEEKTKINAQRKLESAKKKNTAFADAKIAVGNSNADDLQYAIDAGASVNTPDEQGETLADLAIKEASPECLTIILQNNFEIHKHGARLLELAGNQLLEHESNPDIATELDACVQILCEFGAQLPQEDELPQQESLELEAQPDTDEEASDFDNTFYLKEELDTLLADDPLEDVTKAVTTHRPPPPTQSPQSLMPNTRLVDYEIARQTFEKARSFPGQETATPLICSISPGKFITAGGFKRPYLPNFEIRDPVIRIWNNYGTCTGDFDGSMTLVNTKDGKYEPRSLCMINAQFLAVGYDTTIVHIYDTDTQELANRLDLQGVPNSSPRLTSPRGSFRKKTFTDNSAKSPPGTPEVSRARSGSSASLSPRSLRSLFADKESKTAESSAVQIPVNKVSRSTTISVMSPPSTPDMLRNRTASTSGISPRGQKLAPVKVDLCHWPSLGFNLLATTYQTTVKTWDTERGICLTQLKDERAKNIIKIRPLDKQGLFGLDDQGNAFIWDNRESTAKKAVGFFKVASKKVNPCVATFDQHNLVAISYQEIDATGSLIKLWDIRKYKAPCLLVGQKIPNSAFGSTFCALNNDELAFTTSSRSNIVKGELVGLYHIGHRTVRYVDLISQDPADPSEKLPKVIAMEKIGEQTLAIGVSSEKGLNTLKISQTDQKEYRHNSEACDASTFRAVGK